MAVNLSKGQKISLSKGGDSPSSSDDGLKKIVMGVGWDVAKQPGILWGTREGDPIDLDASCILFDSGKQMVDAVWFRQLKSKDGSIAHTGDNRTGEGEGDDEQIRVELDRVPGNVASLVFTVNSFTGETFDRVENAFCRLVDALTGQEIARYNLSGQGRHTALIMAKVMREGDTWQMQAVGENGRGRTIEDLVPAVQAIL